MGDTSSSNPIPQTFIIIDEAVGVDDLNFEGVEQWCQQLGITILHVTARINDILENGKLRRTK